jgi:hypothetical protein
VILDCVYVFWNTPWLLYTSKGSLAGRSGRFLGVIIPSIASQLLLYKSFNENRLISGRPGGRDLGLIVLVIVSHFVRTRENQKWNTGENEDMG